jgi:hypothetical protein
MSAARFLHAPDPALLWLVELVKVEFARSAS